MREGTLELSTVLQEREDVVHPMIAEQLVKARGRDRLAEAAHARLVREAREQRAEAEAGHRPARVRAFAQFLRGWILRLRRASEARPKALVASGGLSNKRRGHGRQA